MALDERVPTQQAGKAATIEEPPKYLCSVPDCTRPALHHIARPDDTGWILVCDPHMRDCAKDKLLAMALRRPLRPSGGYDPVPAKRLYMTLEFVYEYFFLPTGEFCVWRYNEAEHANCLVYCDEQRIPIEEVLSNRVLGKVNVIEWRAWLAAKRKDMGLIVGECGVFRCHADASHVATWHGREVKFCFQHWYEFRIRSSSKSSGELSHKDSVQ